MAYDSPLSAFEDIGRILSHIADVVPSAAGIGPMVATFNQNIYDMRVAALVKDRATPPLPAPDLGSQAKADTAQDKADAAQGKADTAQAATLEPPPPPDAP